MARIERHEDQSRRGNSEIQLEVAVAVRRDHCNAVAPLKTETAKDSDEALDALAELVVAPRPFPAHHSGLIAGD
jgi:hypothetical protein